MSTSRNQPCPCGSGLRFKKCCGRISDDPRTFSPSMSFMDIRSLESGSGEGLLDASERKIDELLRQGNLPHAEMLLRMSLEKDPGNPKALNFLGWIANAVNLPRFAIHYFSEAARLAPAWRAPRVNLEKVNQHMEKAPCGQAANERETKPAAAAGRFLLIKAWGYGFWSDVSHVLSQFLLAEITGRVPVVHWGSNSLFGDGTGSNAFEFYFENPSNVGVDDLQKENFDFWPPKWNRHNLTEGEINKWDGSFSRVAGLYLLSRSERVIVSDFYSSVIDLKPWIPFDHHLHGLSVDELYRYLIRRYLRPRQEILDDADRFYEEHLGSPDFIAVHARGSDKTGELPTLQKVNRQYKETIDRLLSVHNCRRIFLMTDDSRVLDYFSGLYGDNVVTTDCQRTNNTTGIHYQAASDKRRLGQEVMVDTYTAARGRAFVGNGFSNPSVIVRYLKDWPDEDVHLVGPNICHTFHVVLHDWQLYR